MSWLPGRVLYGELAGSTGARGRSFLCNGYHTVTSVERHEVTSYSFSSQNRDLEVNS